MAIYISIDFDTCSHCAKWQKYILTKSQKFFRDTKLLEITDHFIIAYCSWCVIDDDKRMT